jgi:hypothetical protein
MSEPINPVALEAAIRDCAERIAKGVRVCSDRYAAFLIAEHDYDLAYAKAYLASDGPAHEKRYEAELDTEGQRAARDAADAAYRYADRQAKALEAELRALQSVGASTRAMFAVAGRGEGA